MEPVKNSGVVEINGARIVYELAGDGPALVLIHAGICDRRMWDDHLSVFAQRHRVVRYDLRGFGESSSPPGSYAHHEDLRALLDVLQVDRAAVLGVSMGGEVALKTALTYPGRVGALILSTTRAGATAPSAAVERLWRDADEAYETGDLAAAVEIEQRGWVDGPHRPPEQVDPAVRERVRIMNTALWERIAHESDAGKEAEFSPPLHERLGEVAVPTLLIVGNLDQPEIVSSMETLAATIPGAETVIIEATAHLPSMERPQEFDDAVLDFLRRHW